MPRENKIIPFKQSHTKLANLFRSRPYSLGGLFVLQNKTSLITKFDWTTESRCKGDLGEWRIGNQCIVDDLLTSTCLYTFSRETFKRLAVIRPSRSALTFLGFLNLDALVFSAEPRIRQQVLEFGVSKEMEMQWQAFIWGRQQLHDEIYQSIAGSDAHASYLKMLYRRKEGELAA